MEMGGTRPRILLIGHHQGNPDEGMKNISRHLIASLSAKPSVAVRLVSPAATVPQLASISAWGPDIVHYVHGPSYRSVFIAWLLKNRLRQARIVLSLTHPVLNSIGQRLLARLPPHQVWASSTSWHQWCKQRGIPSLFFPLAGVNVGRFHPVSGEEKIRLREKLGFPADRTLVLHVGHLRRGRNLLALAPIQQDSSKQLVILGSTYKRPDRSLVSTLQAAGCIVRNDYVPAVQEYYQAADCYVFPTVDAKEAIAVPLSVLEAMATNLPVLSTRFGGLPDIFQPGDGLRFIEAEDLPNLADIIDTLLRVSRVHTREQALLHDWNVVLGKLLDRYQALLVH